ncbi:MAG: gliding motility-associated C-terminal domain-containing protein [Bacteroidota bacterium]
MPINRFFVFLILGWLVTSFANAQPYPSGPIGNFSVNQIRGCTPLTVSVTDLSDNPLNDPRFYNFDYRPGERIPVNPTTIEDTTYAIPGSYLIIQVVGSEVDSIRIEALEPRTPQFQLINCTNNRVFVDIQDDYYDELEIDFGDGTVAVLPTTQPSFVHPYAAAGTYPVTVRGLFNEADNSGCADSTVQFNTFDGGTFPEATLSLVEVLDDQQIRVEYTLPNDDISYQVMVSENRGNSSRSYPLAPGTTEAIVEQDEWDTRSNYYCLTVAAIDPCAGSTFPSNELCTIVLDAEADNLQNNLNWESQPDLFDQYQVFKDGNQVITSTLTNYEDTDVICQETYDYQVRSSDGTGVSLSETIALTAISTEVPDSITALTIGLIDLSIVLEWPEVAEAQQYYIYRALSDSTYVLYDSVSTDADELEYVDSSVEIDQEYCYQVTYLGDCDNESAVSNEVCLRVPSQAQVFLPNAFTPNGDGLNDVFLYKAALVESVIFEVYNRWGELIFSTNQLDVGWDGTYNGVLASQGTYIYKIDVTDQLGNQFTQQGKVVLLN